MDQWELTAIIAEARHHQSTTLFLSGEGLEFLPPEIGNLPNLKDLNLVNNQLTELPPEIGNLTNLEWLGLGGNQLKELPPELWNLTHLKVLSLYANQLTALPPEIGNLTHLEWLGLGDNQFTELPPELWNLTRFMYQVIAMAEEQRVQVQRLSDGVTAMLERDANVTRVKKSSFPGPDASGQNSVGNGRTSRQIRQERWFWDSNTIAARNLAKGDQIWGDGLKNLILTGNQLTKLSPKIGNLDNLEWLNLDGNLLTELPPELCNLARLKVLSMRGNQLTELPPEIGKLARLAELYLNDNELTALPREIGDLFYLFRVGLDGNYFNPRTALPIEMGNRMVWGRGVGILTT